MMQQKIEKGSDEWNLFMDFWKLHQDYYNPQTEKEWNLLLNAENEMAEKYKNTELEYFARGLILAHTNNCERKNKMK